ncbi:MAG: BTAD domain-containing putative transcriptional regulator [Trueperaceae bacterium]
MFGPFVVERDGEPLRGFRSDKVRALLAYLAVQVDRPWSRSTLADLLWPEQPESTARSNLRNALSNLRHVLADARAEPPFLRLSQAAVEANGAAERWVDVDAFRHLRVGVADAQAAEVDPNVVPRLEDALQLYRGPFLEGFSLASAPFESWLSTTREELHRQAVATARVLAFAHARLGDAEAATVITRRWLDLEPYEDAALRHLMRLLVLRDHRSDALAQFEAFHARLAQDLGMEPEPETTRQYEGIRAERATAAPLPVSAWPGLQRGDPGSPAEPLFVARDAELGRLTGSLERAVAGRAGVAFVTGEPGSGKTALLAEFVRRALADHPDLIALWGQGNAFTGHGDPFEPFRHMARMLAGEAEAPPAAGASRAEGALRLWRCLPATLDALLDHGPDLLDRFVSGQALLGFARRHAGATADQLVRFERRLAQSSPATGRRGAGDRSAPFEQFTDVVRALAVQCPVVLVLDDLHWIDSGSSDLLFHLARGLAGARVLLLGAYREEEAAHGSVGDARSLAAAVEELLTVDGSLRIDLTHAGDAPFVDALLDSEPNALGPAFRSRLFGHTAGNPLFTIELLRGMQLRGDLRRDRRGRWIDAPSLRWDDVPARVEAVIEGRIAHLSPACRELLSAAAVEGEQFTAEVAAAATDRPVAHACELLSDEAGRQHLLVAAHAVQSVGGTSLALYRFRHGLFQTRLYQRLDPVERARLHGRVGRELERWYRSDPGRTPELALALARHLEAAGRTGDAVAAYADAARHAVGLSANAAAVGHLGRALALLQTLPASAARDRQEFGLQLALGPPLTALKGWSPPELAAAYARAEALSHGIEDDAQLIPALWLLSVFRLGRSEHAAVERLWERMTRLASRSGDAALVALTRLNVAAFYRGRFVEGRRLLEDACAKADVEVQRQLARRFGMAPAVLALAYLAECAWILDLPGEAERRGDEARAWAQRIDHPMTSGYAIGRACWLAALRGDADATRGLAADLRDVAGPHGLEPFALAATFFTHWAAVRAGGTSADLAAMHAAIERYAAGGTSLNRTAFLAHYAGACGDAGEVERGLAAVDASLAEADRSGERWFQAEAWRTKGELLRLRGATSAHRARDLRAVRACFETARRTAQAQGAAAFERRAADPHPLR